MRLIARIQVSFLWLGSVVTDCHNRDEEEKQLFCMQAQMIYKFKRSTLQMTAASIRLY